MYKHDPSVQNRISLYLSSNFFTPSAYSNGTKFDLPNVSSEVGKYKNQMSPITIEIAEDRQREQVTVEVIVQSDVEITG